jgi:Transcription factor zinc-finger
LADTAVAKVSMSEKDRLGDKLHDIEAAREDQWARQHDAVLIKELRDGAALHCPKCGALMTARKVLRHEVLACPSGDGVWVTQRQLESLTKKQG